MGKAISGMVFFTLLTKLLGFLRELLLSFFYGASGISDAYLISQTIPGTIFQFVGTGLTTCFIPIYFKIYSTKGKKECNIFTNKIITIILTFSTLIMIIVWAFTPSIVKLFALGFSGETLSYAIIFTRISISSLYFSSVIYVYNSYLQANNVFTPTASAGIPYSICIIISIVLGSCWNLLVLSVGSVFATFIQLVFLWIFVKKTDFRIHLDFFWKDSQIENFFLLMIPVVMGVSVNEINTLIDKTVASQVTVGGISALNYANSLIMFVLGGIAQPLATVYYPRITKKISERQYRLGKEDVHHASQLLLVLLLPITFGLVILSEPIIKNLFGRGAFDNNAIRLTSIALACYAIGLVFMGLRELLSRYYYAFGNTKRPMINSTFGMIINIILNITFAPYIGIAGMALATSISALVTTALLWLNCKSLSPKATLIINKIELIKIIIASFAMGIIVFTCKYFFPEMGFFSLFITIFISILAYLLFCISLHIQIVVDSLKYLLKKWKSVF